jgi:membrane-associated phospholipid phosphatase
LFWLENVPYSWNNITRNLIIENNLPGWKAAQLLALVHIAEADANIGVFEAKYFYNFWRPITAVRMGETDGNANTAGDAAWNVLAPPTPPVPDYPSNHAADGGAAAEVLKRYFGKDDISFSATSSFLPGVTRKYMSLSQAATEVSLSHIYVGYHYRSAVVEGEKMGREIGAFVYQNSLQELK